jgi:hypothetical protein
MNIEVVTAIVRDNSVGLAISDKALVLSLEVAKWGTLHCERVRDDRDGWGDRVHHLELG